MKKVSILAFIGILTISLIGCGINSKLKSTISNDKSNDLSNNRSIDKKIVLDDASDINIDVCAAEVSIKSYDGEEVKITGRLSKNSEGIDINKNSNVIGIVEKGYKIMGSIINTENNISKFDILVPSKFKGNLIFNQGAGTSVIEGIKVKNIDITGGAGELKCENIKFDKLNLNSGVGKVDLNLNEKCGDIIINGGVGEVNIKMAEVGGDLIYEGGVGSSDITIPENSPVRFITQKGIGECKIDAKTSGKGTYTLDLKVGVGSISVHN